MRKTSELNFIESQELKYKHYLLQEKQELSKNKELEILKKKVLLNEYKTPRHYKPDASTYKNRRRTGRRLKYFIDKF